MINTETNATARITTTSTGEYSAANPEPGVYRIEVAMTGFQTAIIDGVTLTTGATARADVRLQVGGGTQTIEVQAANIQLQTEDAKVSTSVPNKMVDDLPLVVGGAMRSPFDLASTVPEAKGGTGIILGGGQSGASAATFDGLSVNTNRQANTTETNFLTPSVEAITEFAVDTNGFKAEYSQAGGGVISFASKSGTNVLHDSAYDFIRNDDVDARGFFPSPSASTNRTTTARRSAGQSGFLSSTTEKTRPFSSFLTKALRTGRVARVVSRPSPHRRCTRAISPTW